MEHDNLEHAARLAEKLKLQMQDQEAQQNGCLQGMGINIDRVHVRQPMASVQVEVPACHGFPAALTHLIVARGHVTRVGWNGRNMHVEAQWPDAHSKMGKPYLFISDIYGVKTPWVPSQGDLFANDWALLPPGHVGDIPF